MRTEGSDSEWSRQDGESRWMMIDGWIVEDRHGCLSGCPSGRPNGRPSGVGCQRFGLVGIRR